MLLFSHGTTTTDWSITHPNTVRIFLTFKNDRSFLQISMLNHCYALQLKYIFKRAMFLYAEFINTLFNEFCTKIQLQFRPNTVFKLGNIKIKAIVNRDYMILKLSFAFKF